MAGGSSIGPPVPRAGMNTLVYLGELWKWARRTKVKAGKGLRQTQTEDGITISLMGEASATATTHPFKLSAVFDDDGTPTICLVSIRSGTLQGTLATGSTYLGVPLFEGSGGTALNATTPPTFNVGVTARTNYFYFNVSTDEYGKVDNVWIDHLVAAGVPPAETAYIQPGFPLASDVGAAGEYFWLLGSVTVAEAAGVYSISISQGVETNLAFYTCGGEGRFGAA